jgi:type IX secretion system PorP/SprF family membrane protein
MIIKNINLRNKINLLLVLTPLFLFCQQESYYSLYQYNMNVINPAFAGTQEGGLITILDRNQWAGLEGSPRTLSLTYSRPMGNNVGLGVSIVSDKVFIEQQTFAYIDFSYQLQVEEKTILFLGLKAGGNFYNADPSDLISYSSLPDPSQISLSSFNPNIGVGLYATRDNHWFSFSIPRLFNARRSDDLAVTAKDRVHTYIGGGSEFFINEDFSVKPSLMLRKVKGLPLSADITSFVSYQSKYDLGFSIRTKAAFSIMMFLPQIYEGFDLGYAYEAPTAKRLSVTGNKTHEILLRINLGERKKSKSEPKSAQ